ncbi:MAG TPA: rod shape-determining protein [Patescibacteria group bacterium]
MSNGYYISMIFERLDKLSKVVAVDLGTSMTRVWVGGQGLVVEQPSFLAVDVTSQRILSIGLDAQQMMGRTAANVQVFRPIQQGQLWDTTVAKAFLQALLREILGKSFFNPTLVLSVPAGIKPAVEEETVQLGYDLGAREVLTVAQPLAAAIGAGMPVVDATGGFILQLGAGINEAAAISLGSLVGVESSYQAGEQFEEQVISTLKTTKKISISRETAGQLIAGLATLSDTELAPVLVTGKQQKTAVPKEIELTTADLTEPTQLMAESYVALVKKLLTKVPTELTVDIVDKGLLLSGSGAKLKGLDEYLVPKLGVPVSVVDEPEQAVIRGMGTILNHLDEYRASLGQQS